MNCADCERSRAEVDRLLSVSLDALERERVTHRRLMAFARERGRLRARVGEVREDLCQYAILDQPPTSRDVSHWITTLEAPCDT